MLNKIELIGRLTRDPEARGNNPEKPIAHLRLAVDRDYKRDGEPTTDFFDVSAFGKQAETLLQYTKKGHLLCVVGSVQFREWTDQQTGDKRYATEVKLSEFHFLEKKEKVASQGASAGVAQSAPIPPAPVAAGSYVAAPQPTSAQGVPMPQPVSSAPAPYGEPDFSGVPESYGFGPGGTALQTPPF